MVPESRNIPRASTKKQGIIDFKKPNNPLLFIADGKDHIIPAGLNKKNFKAYKDSGNIPEYKEFPNATHSILVEQGWKDVAEFVFKWIKN